MDRPAKLTTATVAEAQSTAYAAYQIDSGESVIATVPLSQEELAAYRRHPDTFFGVELNASKSINTPMELFDFFLAGYRDTPKERLLELMVNHPNIGEFQTLPKEDLTEIFAEQCVLSALQHGGLT